MAQKNSYGEKDIDVKGRVSQIIRKHFGITVFIQVENDYPIFIHKDTGQRDDPDPKIYNSKAKILKEFDIFYPDLYTKYRQPCNIFIEIDGPVHWQNSHAVARTNFRNIALGRVGKLIWITDVEARTKNQSDLILNLASKLGMRPSPLPTR